MSRLVLVATKVGIVRHYGDRGLAATALPERTLCGAPTHVRASLAVQGGARRRRGDCCKCAAMIRARVA